MWEKGGGGPVGHSLPDLVVMDQTWQNWLEYIALQLCWVSYVGCGATGGVTQLLLGLPGPAALWAITSDNLIFANSNTVRRVSLVRKLCTRLVAGTGVSGPEWAGGAEQDCGPVTVTDLLLSLLIYLPRTYESHCRTAQPQISVQGLQQKTNSWGGYCKLYSSPAVESHFKKNTI